MSHTLYLVNVKANNLANIERVLSEFENSFNLEEENVEVFLLYKSEDFFKEYKHRLKSIFEFKGIIIFNFSPDNFEKISDLLISELTPIVETKTTQLVREEVGIDQIEIATNRLKSYLNDGQLLFSTQDIVTINKYTIQNITDEKMKKLEKIKNNILRASVLQRRFSTYATQLTFSLKDLNYTQGQAFPTIEELEHFVEIEKEKKRRFIDLKSSSLELPKELNDILVNKSLFQSFGLSHLISFLDNEFFALVGGRSENTGNLLRVVISNETKGYFLFWFQVSDEQSYLIAGDRRDRDVLVSNIEYDLDLVTFENEALPFFEIIVPNNKPLISKLFSDHSAMGNIYSLNPEFSENSIKRNHSWASTIKTLLSEDIGISINKSVKLKVVATYRTKDPDLDLELIYEHTNSKETFVGLTPKY